MVEGGNTTRKRQRTRMACKLSITDIDRPLTCFTLILCLVASSCNASHPVSGVHLADQRQRVDRHLEHDESNIFNEDGGELKFLGNDPDPYRLCEGDCDKDDDCKGDLICFQRDGYGAVPGCSGDGKEDVDYCIVPEQPDEETDDPTISPTAEPETDDPTPSPTEKPETDDPTPSPTEKPETDDPTPSPTEKPETDDPTPSPTEKPETKSPTVSPTPKATGDADDSLDYVSNGGGVLLGLCEGDCDSDADCEGDLKCFERDDEDVPGCSGEGAGGIDYCTLPEFVESTEEETEDPTQLPTARPATPVPSPDPTTAPTERATVDVLSTDTLTFVGGTSFPPYGECIGDCDNDSDCIGSLKCFSRDGTETVPGCKGSGVSLVDYCYDPEKDTSAPTQEPTIGETEELTPSPTEDEEIVVTAPISSGVLIVLEKDPNFLLNHCEGDCDSDDECFPGLYCLKRKDDSPDIVEGCKGIAEPNKDYCIDPNFVQPSSDPTKRPTRNPTTRRPTKAPSTKRPTPRPTRRPTARPSPMPSRLPTTLFPTPSPTFFPPESPSKRPVAPIALPSATPRPSLTPSPPPSIDGNLDLSDPGIAPTDRVWVALSPFLVSLKFQVGRRVRSLHSRSLLLNTQINVNNLDFILRDLLTNEMGKLSPDFSGLLLDIFFKEESTLADIMTVDYVVTGSAAFAKNTSTGTTPPSKSEVRVATAKALNGNILLKDLRELHDEDPVLASVQSLSVSWVAAENENAGLSRPMQIVILAMIIVAIFGVLAIAFLFMRNMRRKRQQYSVEPGSDSSSPRRSDGKETDPKLMATTNPTYEDMESAAPDMEGSVCGKSASDWSVNFVGANANENISRRPPSSPSLSELASTSIIGRTLDTGMKTAPSFESGSSLGENMTAGELSGADTFTRDIQLHSVLQLEEGLGDVSDIIGDGDTAPGNKQDFAKVWKSPKRGGKTSSDVEDRVLGISLSNTPPGMKDMTDVQGTRRAGAR